jgi:hypothetical protein
MTEGTPRKPPPRKRARKASVPKPQEMSPEPKDMRPEPGLVDTSPCPRDRG